MYKILFLLYMDKWVKEIIWLYDVFNNKVYKICVYFI